jgi:uncharacterized protein (TIGR02145 family)
MKNLAELFKNWKSVTIYKSPMIYQINANINLKKSNTMKKLFMIIFLVVAKNACAQQTPKTFTGPYSFGNNDGTATYTYIERNGERVIDGNFSFNCPTEKITISGKYSKGKKDGLWTRKQNYSRYNGMPVVKADLKWPKVTENIPFKEIADITIENYLNDKLEGVWTQTKTIKNSWGYPAPGGTSSSVLIIKKNFAADEMKSIEAIRKKNDKVNLSLKGFYKNKLADGNWLFNDNKNTYSYSFTNGYLANYEIKEIGSGKLVESKKIEIDNELAVNYFTSSDNNFEVMFGRFYSELQNAKISTQKVNENLSITKLCQLELKPANFINLDLRLFSNAFGEISSNLYEQNEVFAFSPKIECQVLSHDYNLLEKIHFNDIKSEFSFLKSNTDSKGNFLGTDWNKIDRFSNALYFFQIKYYLYSGDSIGLKRFVEESKNYFNWNVSFNQTPLPNGQYVKVGNSEYEFNEYIKFLISISLGETNNWKTFIDSKYNSNSFNKSWQTVIFEQLKEINESTSFNKTFINDVLNYLTNKEDEINKINIEVINDIKEIKIGNQIWMSADLNIIPKNQYYYRIKDNKIQSSKIGNGIILYGQGNINNNICPNGWRIPKNEDWETLIKALGGNKESAGQLLKAGKGSGFETIFPIINFPDGKVQYSSGSLGSYITLDEKNNVSFFNFSSYNYYSQFSYLPCRCIKD